MSWSVSAAGTPAEVRSELERQFALPLADKPSGLTDDGERETVKRIRETMLQTLDTFDPAGNVAATAYGHMGWSEYTTKAGSYQNVYLSVQPALAAS